MIDWQTSTFVFGGVALLCVIGMIYGMYESRDKPGVPADIELGGAVLVGVFFFALVVNLAIWSLWRVLT